MKTLFKWMLRIVLVLAIIAAAFWAWKREELGRLSAVLSLFSEERIVSNFSNMDQIFERRFFPATDAAPSALPQGTSATLPPETATWVTDRSVTSLVVLKDGQIVFDEYYQGTTPADVRINWSISKSYLSALFGILLEEGAVDSIDDPVIKYAPDLALSLIHI